MDDTQRKKENKMRGDHARKSVSDPFLLGAREAIPVMRSRIAGIARHLFSFTSVKLALTALAVAALALIFLVFNTVGSTELNLTLTTNPDLESGLVGHWTFDGEDMDLASSTKEVLDRSGNGNHGNWLDHATTTVPGAIGQAIDFDGTNDSITISDMTYGSTVITLAFWYRSNDVSTSDQLLFESSTNYNNNDKTFIVNFKSGSAGSCQNQFVFSIQDGVSTTRYLQECVPLPSLGQWNYYVAVLDNSTNTGDIVIYKDGVEQSTTVGRTDKDQNGVFVAQPLYVASRAGTNFFNKGVLDDVRIYNRALFQEEITRLYHLGATTKLNKTLTTNPNLENGLVGHWTFDGEDMDLASSTAEVRDRSSSGYKGDWLDHATTTRAGKIGQAVELDGTDDQITVSDFPNWGATDDFTVAFWTKRFATGSGDLLGDRAGLNAGNGGWVVYFAGAGGTLTFEVSDGTDEYSLSASGTSPGAEWNHVVMVWDDDSADGTELYLNGVDLNAADTGTIGNIGDVGNGAGVVLILGGRINGTSPLQGFLDDVRIYDRVLSQDDITRLYHLGATTKLNETLTTNPDLENGLEGHWTFDGKDMDISSSTAEVRDRSGSGYHGDWLEHATTTRAGKIGQAVELDGTDDYITMSDVPNRGASDDFTFSLWVNRGRSGVSEPVLADRLGILASQAGYLMFFRAEDDTLRVELSDGTDEYQVSTTQAFTPASGWAHVVFVWDDDSADGTEFYINGVDENGTDAGTIGVIDALSNASDFAVGAESDGGGSFDGLVDDVRLYNRALSPSEIKKLYELGR